MIERDQFAKGARSTGVQFFHSRPEGWYVARYAYVDLPRGTRGAKILNGRTVGIGDRQIFGPFKTYYNAICACGDETYGPGAMIDGMIVGARPELVN